MAPDWQKAMETVKEHGIPRGKRDGLRTKVLLTLYSQNKSWLKH